MGVGLTATPLVLNTFILEGTTMADVDWNALQDRQNTYNDVVDALRARMTKQLRDSAATVNLEDTTEMLKERERLDNE